MGKRLKKLVACAAGFAVWAGAPGGSALASAVDKTGRSGRGELVSQNWITPNPLPAAGGRVEVILEAPPEPAQADVHIGETEVPALLDLATHPERAALPAPVESMSAGESSAAASAQMDRILGISPASPRGDAVVLEDAPEPPASGLRPSGFSSRGPPAAQPPKGPTGWLRILPDRESNRKLWSYLGVTSLFTAGYNAFYSALPGLLSGPGGAQPGNLGTGRAVSYAGQAAGNFVTGPILGRFSVGRILSTSWFGRSPGIFLVAALSLAVPYGYLSFQTFFLLSLPLFALEGLLQSLSITAGNVVYNRTVGMDEAHYNKASAIYDILGNVVGAAASLGAAFMIKGLNGLFGIPHLGETAMVALFAVTLIGCGIWAHFLRADQGTPAPKPSSRPLLEQLRDGWKLILGERFLWVTLFFCTLEYMTASAFFYPMLSRYMNEMLQAAGSAGIFGPDGAFGLYLGVSYLGPLLACFAMMLWRNRPMAALESALSAFRERAGADPLEAEKAREGIREVLAEYRGAWKADPAVVWTREQFREKAVSRSPGFAPELDAWLESQFEPLLREARKEAKTGHDFLERQWKLTTVLFGIGALFYIGVFFSSGLGASLTFMFLSTLLEAPAVVTSMSMMQRVLQSRYSKKMGEIYAAQFLYANLLIILGLFVFVYLMNVLSMYWLVWVVAGVQAVDAALRFLVARFALPRK